MRVVRSEFYSWDKWTEDEGGRADGRPVRSESAAVERGLLAAAVQSFGASVSSTKTQSPSPSALLPGGMKLCWPELAMGELSMA